MSTTKMWDPSTEIEPIPDTLKPSEYQIIMNSKPLLVKKMHPDAKLPVRGTEGSAGLDVFAIEDTVIPAGGANYVQVGLAIQLPPDTMAEFRLRGSFGCKKSLLLHIAPIDEDYRGVIFPYIFNQNSHDVLIRKGERFCQMVITNYIKLDPEWVNELDTTSRGAGCLGSTGST